MDSHVRVAWKLVMKSEAFWSTLGSPYFHGCLPSSSLENALLVSDASSQASSTLRVGFLGLKKAKKEVHFLRFKEMKEIHGSSSCDDRQKRELQRQEREMAKFAQMADAHKQQQQRQKQVEESGSGQVSNPLRNATALAYQDQRKALKFGFSSKSGTSKKPTGGAAKKPKVAIAPVFSNDSDEEQ
ncbi:hypothetical protein GH714_026528 [Hevea brasiliensis]|uniref:Uncharacterized protein n=1 Tax=Hevea brasiliensis TaxID=3981 RepID=A0A6A6M5V2_HEVBR|nr:hypothetical protein GH714_026528 [Hevea brasiliensis]